MLPIKGGPEGRSHPLFSIDIGLNRLKKQFRRNVKDHEGAHTVAPTWSLF